MTRDPRTKLFKISDRSVPRPGHRANGIFGPQKTFKVNHGILKF